MSEPESPDHVISHYLANPGENLHRNTLAILNHVRITLARIRDAWHPDMWLPLRLQTPHDQPPDCRRVQDCVG